MFPIFVEKIGMDNDDFPPANFNITDAQKASAVHIELSISTNPIPPATGKTLSILMTNKSLLPDSDVIDSSNPNQPALIVPDNAPPLSPRIFYITLDPSWDWQFNIDNKNKKPLGFEYSNDASYYQISIVSGFYNNFYLLCKSTGQPPVVSHPFNIYFNMQASQPSKLPIIIDPTLKNPPAKPGCF